MEDVQLYNGDCLEVMDKLIEQGIKFDAIITDPPYGTTQCKWDSVIPFDKMWERLNKLIKPNGAIVLFGSEPFSSALRMSNIKNYKYDWIWEKEQGTGQLNAKIMPLKNHETISIFSNVNFKNTPYYPQMTISDKPYNRNDIGKVNNEKEKVYGKSNGYSAKNVTTRYPKTVQKFQRVNEKGQHPTQKPVPLMEFLIKTYTNENEVVLDFTMGSGSTGVACVNTNRKFIGIELDEKYFAIAKERIKKYSSVQDI